MELLILAGVGLAGYKISNGARRPAAMSYPNMPSADGRGVCGEGDYARNERARAAGAQMLSRDFAASRDPCGTGVIAPNQREVFARSNLPAYRSEKSQASSEAYKQSRMELFTGQLEQCRSKTGTFASKQETGPMFSPAISKMPVSFSGRQAYVDLRGAQDEERYAVGMKHHGAGPVDPIRVGPGLGLDANVPAAGGFHQFFQVLPENVNGYRKNSLPGRINPGRAPVQQGTNIGVVHTNTTVDKPVWNLDRMPLMPGKCHLDAPPVQGVQPVSRRRDDTQGFVGHAFGGTLAPPSDLSRNVVRHGRQDDRCSGPFLNAYGGGVQVGGYCTQPRDDPGAFRQQLQALPIGSVAGTMVGGFPLGDKSVRPTQREQGGFATNVAAAHGGPSIRQAQATRAATGRETLKAPPMVGVARGPEAPAGCGSVSGLRAKPDTCVGYMPNGGTQNMYQPNMTSARLRDPANAAHLNGGGLQSVNYGRPGSDQRCYNKLPVQANLDLGLAKDVLSTNPLTHPIFD